MHSAPARTSYTSAFYNLSPADQRQLERAAWSRLEGGNEVEDSALSAAVHYGLVYLCTGRLKPVVYKMLRDGSLWV